MLCPACKTEIRDPGRFCFACGSPTDASAIPTVAMQERRTPSSSGSSDEGRFPAGTILGERYRVLGLLGRGGMGEVYRAHDLKLEQQVALKFLPPATARDSRLLERFRGEVRIARQVSHRNVCRVFDLGEVEGSPYISMEYVDGEDLGSLLRRIGRLPGDKAIEFARRLCAGLAAAHEKGVLHRDLKPANIMIDGRGQVLIMDFGLAAASDGVAGGDIRSGTPAYMAPEQKEGREVTVRSDIYSLGLVFAEMFTGQKDSKLSGTVKDLDPAVEKVIQRCLDPNPSKRPPSALDVARALPGGDPLAEALAAGDTPSPEMVAASEDTGALSVRGAVACLALVVAVAAAMMFTANRYSAINMTPMPYSAENLELKAHETTVALGYTAAPFDTYRGFDADIELSRWMTMNLGPDERRALAAQGEPAVPTFEYGQSRVYLTPQNPFGTISRSDPERSPGAVDLQLDPQGRLRWLRVIPSKEPANGAAAAFDWNRLFSAAGLDMSRWTRADAAEIPPVPFDAQAAWTGTLPNLPKATLRIEAAAWKGRPVYFEMFGPWRPDRRPALSARADPPVGVIVIFVLVAISAPLFAVRNLRTSRGDLAGAARLGVILLIGNFATGLLTIHHTASVDEIRILLARLGLALLVGGAGWTLYMAVEPYVRRHWPQALIGWTRALGGNFRDPMVAGHILVGIAAGAVLALIFMAQGHLRGNLLGIPTLEAKTAVADWFNVTTSPIVALLYFFIFLLLRLVLRRTWIAVIAAVALAVFANLAGPAAAGTLSPAVVVLGLGISLYVAVGVRFGVLALAAMLFALLSFQRYPLTPNFSAWFAPLGLLNLALMMAIVVWCFKNALGGRKVFKSDILES